MSHKQLSHYELRQRQSWIEHDNMNQEDDYGPYPEDVFEEALFRIKEQEAFIDTATKE